jgi:hypothetical protein
MVMAMGIKKQEFYEGAALHLLARTNKLTAIRYEAPLFIVNENLLLLLKYSTRGRSPWAFTFTPGEQLLLERRSLSARLAIGLICGADGVATFGCDAYFAVAKVRSRSIHISCYRQHGQHYEVSGPGGRMERRIAPSQWPRILEPRGNDETP